MTGEIEPDRPVSTGRPMPRASALDYTATLALISETSGSYDRMRLEHATLSEYSAQLLEMVQAERSELRRTIARLEGQMTAKDRKIVELQRSKSESDRIQLGLGQENAQIKQRYRDLEAFCEEIILAIQPLLNLESNPMLSKSTLMPLLQSIEAGG